MSEEVVDISGLDKGLLLLMMHECTPCHGFLIPPPTPSVVTLRQMAVAGPIGMALGRLFNVDLRGETAKANGFDRVERHGRFVYGTLARIVEVLRRALALPAPLDAAREKAASILKEAPRYFSSELYINDQAIEAVCVATCHAVRASALGEDDLANRLNELRRAIDTMYLVTSPTVVYVMREVHQKTEAAISAAEKENDTTI